MADATGHVEFLSRTLDGKPYAALAIAQGRDLYHIESQQPIPSTTGF